MSSSKLDAVADVPASLPPSPSPPSSSSLHKTSAGTSLEGVAPGGAVGQPVALQAAGAAAAVTSVRAVALSHRLTTAAFADTTSVAGPVFKVVLVGDVGTGKSTLQRSWASTCGAGTPSSAGGAASAAAPLPTALAAAYATHDTANTAHFEVLTVQEQGELCKVHVWDTPGAEKWRRLVSTYLRQSNAIVIMYDITRPATFESVRTHWLQDVKRHVPRGCLVLLLGTKADLRLPPSAPGAAAQVPAAAVAELCAATLQGVETESHEVCINSAADVQALLHHIVAGCLYARPMTSPVSHDTMEHAALIRRASAGYDGELAGEGEEDGEESRRAAASASLMSSAWWASRLKDILPC